VVFLTSPRLCVSAVKDETFVDSLIRGTQRRDDARAQRLETTESIRIRKMLLYFSASPMWMGCVVDVPGIAGLLNLVNSRVVHNY